MSKEVGEMVRSRDVVQAEGSARTEGARRATGVPADGAAAGAGSLAIAFQNRCCSSRPATGGRPGERIAGRPARSDRLRFRFCIAAPHHRGVATTS